MLGTNFAVPCSPSTKCEPALMWHENVRSGYFHMDMEDVVCRGSCVLKQG